MTYDPDATRRTLAAIDAQLPGADGHPDDPEWEDSPTAARWAPHDDDEPLKPAGYPAQLRYPTVAQLDAVAHRDGWGRFIAEAPDAHAVWVDAEEVPFPADEHGATIRAALARLALPPGSPVYYVWEAQPVEADDAWLPAIAAAGAATAAAVRQMGEAFRQLLGLDWPALGRALARAEGREPPPAPRTDGRPPLPRPAHRPPAWAVDATRHRPPRRLRRVD